MIDSSSYYYYYCDDESSQFEYHIRRTSSGGGSFSFSPFECSTTSEPASSSNLKYQRRRRRRSSWWHSTMTSCISQWWMTQWCSTMCRPGPPQHVTCCRGSSRIPFVVSSSQKSSSSWCSCGWCQHSFVVPNPPQSAAVLATRSRTFGFLLVSRVGIANRSVTTLDTS